MIFQYFCQLFVPRSEGPPLRSSSHCNHDQLGENADLYRDFAYLANILDVSNNCFKPFQNDEFRLFQTERVCRRQFQIRQKVHQTGRKHCGKRSNFSLRAISSFSAIFFKRPLLQTRCLERVNPVKNQSVKNTGVTFVSGANERNQ